MFNVRVEYESTPIRHIAVQCPSCENWFYGNDITNDNLWYGYEIGFAKFTCPVCGEEFSGKHSEEEVSYPAVYDECLTKKEVWA